MKAIEINGKYYLECHIVMTPTEKSDSILSKNILTNNIKYASILCDESLGSVSQHLYILSDEEIKEGDWCLNITTNKIGKCTEVNNTLIKTLIGEEDYFDELSSKDSFKKIIATTDSSLNSGLQSGKIYTKQAKGTAYEPDTIYKINQDFINHFITEYNKGNIIIKGHVEVEEKRYFESNKELRSGPNNGFYYKHKFVTNFDNEIYIRIIPSEDELNGLDEVESFVKTHYSFFTEDTRNKMVLGIKDYTRSKQIK